MVAASKAGISYHRWTRSTEFRFLAHYRQSKPEIAAVPQMVVLILANAAEIDVVSVTVASIRKAIRKPVIYCTTGGGDGVTVLPGDCLATRIQALAQVHADSWILPILAGDQISESLVDAVARSIGTDRATFVYWDEDVLRAGHRCEPWVKPEWDPLLVAALGGMVGASCVSFAALGDAASRIPPSTPVDCDQFERLLLEVAAEHRPAHIPLVLTHRADRPARTYAIAKSYPAEPPRWPSVSIIVPTRDKPRLLSACLQGVNRIDYPGRVELIVVDNGSHDPRAVELLAGLEREGKAIVVRDEDEFNFARLNNLAARRATGEMLCLLNNDVEPLGNGHSWLKSLVTFANQADVGAVGAQLLYPSGRIQHAGVAIGLGGAAGHVQKGVHPSERRFWTWHAVTREVSAVTAAVLVVRRSTFVEVGGFDEEFAVAFNDVDFCLRLKQVGLRNIYVAEAKLVHRESESRGKDRSPDQARRFAKELARLQLRWGTEDYLDPHFSPLFSRLVERCVLAP